MRFFTLILLIHLSAFALAQSPVIYTNWEFDQKLHKITIDGLDKQSRKQKKLYLSYQEAMPNAVDFKKLSKSSLYSNQPKTFRVNKCRFSGSLIGLDASGDQRFLIEFSKGKLDGNFIIYHTNGQKSTTVFMQGKAISDPISIKQK